jgi:hypothetical protein
MISVVTSIPSFPNCDNIKSWLFTMVIGVCGHISPYDGIIYNAIFYKVNAKISKMHVGPLEENC